MQMLHKYIKMVIIIITSYKLFLDIEIRFLKTNLQNRPDKTADVTTNTVIWTGWIWNIAAISKTSVLRLALPPPLWALLWLRLSSTPILSLLPSFSLSWRFWFRCLLDLANKAFYAKIQAFKTVRRRRCITSFCAASLKCIHSQRQVFSWKLRLWT